MAELAVTGLHKSYGAHKVLNGLGFTAAPGSFTSILGPSGSGKTTLLRVIAGFERADSGAVHLAGEMVDGGPVHVPPDRRRVGYVPQDGSLFPHLTVEGNVAFGLPRRARRGGAAGRLLSMVGLEGLERRYPHQLSGGQQQRVALARALAVRPSIVLLDEPFSSLDAGLRAAVRQDVRRVLAEAGATVLLVTHDQDEALSLSDKVAVIEDGRVGQYDTPDGLYARPASPAVALAVGQANLLPGTALGPLAETSLGRLSLGCPIPGGATALLVMVRPEQLAIAPGPAGEGVLAQVLDREYFGHDAVVRLRAEGLPDQVLTLRTADSSALPEAGARVALTVRGNVVAWPVVGAQASQGIS